MPSISPVLAYTYALRPLRAEAPPSPAARTENTWRHAFINYYLGLGYGAAQAEAKADIMVARYSPFAPAEKASFTTYQQEQKSPQWFDRNVKPRNERAAKTAVLAPNSSSAIDIYV
ncbi:MAG: hypothetical protein AB7G80_06015 [Dongiaceae bacterium]